ELVRRGGVESAVQEREGGIRAGGTPEGYVLPAGADPHARLRLRACERQGSPVALALDQTVVRQVRGARQASRGGGQGHHRPARTGPEGSCEKAPELPVCRYSRHTDGGGLEQRDPSDRRGVPQDSRKILSGVQTAVSGLDRQTQMAAVAYRMVSLGHGWSGIISP